LIGVTEANFGFFLAAAQNRTNISKFPKEIKNESVLKSIDFINTLALRFHIGHNTDIKLSGEYIQNNLYTENKYVGFFSDLETSYTIPKKKLTLSIKLENITNQDKYFSLSSYSALSQSFFSIPLIKRNIFASMRYEL
jgi:TonB dependent receptor